MFHFSWMDDFKAHEMTSNQEELSIDVLPPSPLRENLDDFFFLFWVELMRDFSDEDVSV